MNIIFFGGGAFGIAVSHILGNANPTYGIHIYDNNESLIDYLNLYRKHPYLSKGLTLSKNLSFHKNYITLPDADLLFIALPNKCIEECLITTGEMLKNKSIIVNLSKGYSFEKNEFCSDIVTRVIGDRISSYNVLSGGMIAKEVIDGNPLGADLGTTKQEDAQIIANLFEKTNISISIKNNFRAIELLGMIKNICAMYVGYLQGKGYTQSTVSFYLCKLLSDFQMLFKAFGIKEDITFSSYAYGGDLLTTCFGDSRNRYFGKLVGEGMSTQDAIIKLKQENKFSEGFISLSALCSIINKYELQEFRKVYNIFF